MPVPLVFLIAGIAIGLLLWLLRSLFSKNLIIKYGSAVVVAALLFWLFFPKINPLKKYGIDYRYDSNASPSLETIDFFINSSNGEIEGPSITGTGLVLKFEDLEKTGIKDIVITKEERSNSRVVIRPLLKDGRAVGFHIVESSHMCVGYYPEGYVCP